MANLETLELTINANATSATEGIDKLTASLRSLSRQIGKSVSGLRLLNKELKDVKSFGGIKMPNVGKATGAKAVSSTAAKTLGYDIEHNNGRGATIKQPNPVADAEWNRKYQENVQKSIQEHAYRRYMNNFYREKERLKSLGLYKEEGQDAKESAKQISNAAEATKAAKEETQGLVTATKENVNASKEATVSAWQVKEATKAETNEIKQAGNIQDETKQKTKELGDESTKAASQMKQSFSGVAKSASGLLSTIGRIFKTMLIRTAIRALLKAAKEGLDNYYQYAKKLNLSFGDAMDTVYKKWTQLKNQLGAAIGGVLRAFLPLLQVVASAAIGALNAITALLALITGSSTYSRAVEGMDDYSDALNKNKKAQKEWIASFDELNVMTKSSGSSSANTDFGSMFEEVELPQWMLEWKPIIEAVLAGTLGMIVLPKIFEWVSKIVTLFTGSGIANTVSTLLNPTSTLPTIPSTVPNYTTAITQLTEMQALLTGIVGTTGTITAEIGGMDAALVGATAAVGALETAILTLIASSAGLSAITAVLEGILAGALIDGSIKLEVDRKAYDDFKKEYEDEWKDGKTIDIVVNDDVAKITKLTQWVAQTDTKTINVVVNDDVAAMTKLTNWIATEETKTINIDIDDDVAKITQLTAWAGTTDKKTIKVAIDDDVAKITQLTQWAAATETKTINISLTGNADALTNLTTWVAKDETKKINVELIGSIATFTALVAWVATEETKKITVSLIGDIDSWTSITAWIGKTDTKKISLSFTGNIDVWTNLVNWIDEIGTKVIDIELRTGTEGSGNGNSGFSDNGGGSILDTDFFTKPIVEVLTDPEAWSIPIWEYLPKLFSNHDPIEVNIDDIVDFTGFADMTESQRKEFVTSIFNAYGSTTAIAELKKKIPNISVKGIISMTDWSSFSSEEQKEFIDALTDAFGADEVTKAAKEAGMDVGDDVTEGINEKVHAPKVTPTANKKDTEKVGKNIKTWLLDKDGLNGTSKKIMLGAEKDKINKTGKNMKSWLTGKDGLNGLSKTIKLSADKKSATSSGSDLKTNLEGKKGINGLSRSIKLSADKGSATKAGDTLKTSLEGKDGLNGLNKEISVSANDDSVKTMKKEIDVVFSGTRKVNVEANITNDFTSTLSSNLSKGIKDALGKTKIYVDKNNNVVVATTQAQGGFVQSGELFIAREAGPELVGTIGNRTAVANNDQIVQGVASGVAAGQAEQNALLRRQNELLMAILQKTGTGLGASSALGRVVSQSLDMYGSLVGR